MEVLMSLAARTTDRRPADRALSLLHAGVPLSLLLDLAVPVPSAELFGQERADTAWVPRRVA